MGGVAAIFGACAGFGEPRKIAAEKTSASRKFLRQGLCIRRLRDAGGLYSRESVAAEERKIARAAGGRNSAIGTWAWVVIGCPRYGYLRRKFHKCDFSEMPFHFWRQRLFFWAADIRRADPMTKIPDRVEQRPPL